MYRSFLKDVFDFYLALILIIIFFPLIFFVYVVSYVLIGSPIYVQTRPGYMNKPFSIYKFKTLIDKNCRNYSPKKKVFKFGIFLRKTGIDEIPQLLNILRGEMSFVGPRPLLMKYLKLKQFAKHPRSKCYPGITGLAQIQKNQNDQKGKWKSILILINFIMKNLSVQLDIKIFFMTILKIILFNRKRGLFN